ncbi:hypothetical protein [Thermophagus xiamenensis]|uniref:Uncharacterized protein n=1 Tax=Thermophagus xiamenensis TaxID=385682 RepID=A0A1I1ZXP0_9BACT|nr:hypothetical protein [Thermophagus xiamenensis]SFE36415.1 hypothetical protein SAMN05444380_11049 [Thermophagus xiamenensis]
MKKFYLGMFLLVLSVNLFGFNVVYDDVTLKSKGCINGVDDCFSGQTIEFIESDEHKGALRQLKNDLFFYHAEDVFGNNILSTNEDFDFISLSEKMDQSTFKIWYSKNDNQIVVTTKENIRFSGVLFDITGTIVSDQRKKFVEERLIFQTSGLKRGIYVVTLYGPGGTVLVISKIVVN